MLRRLATFTVVCAVPFALVACGEQSLSDPRSQAALVRAGTVQVAASSSRAFTGTVAARVQSDIGFRIAGKVMVRFVNAGQTVRRGEPLMQIDPIDLRLASHVQQEAVAAAKAQAQQAAEEEARYRGLRGTGAISASAYDQVKAAADAARAHLRAAEAQAEVAINATRYAQLVADADGVVMETLVEPGQVINAGQVVMRLAHSGPREAVIQLPETMRPALGSAGQGTLFGERDVTVPTRLRQLSDVADPLTRTFEARYVLEGELAGAPLGATVTIQIPDEDPSVQERFQVPIGALYDAGKGPGVWVIEGEPARVSWRTVAVQSLDDDSARVSGQLQRGEQIVALGAHLLREGEQVRVESRDAIVATAGPLP